MAYTEERGKSAAEFQELGRRCGVRKDVPQAVPRAMSVKQPLDDAAPGSTFVAKELNLAGH